VFQIYAILLSQQFDEFLRTAYGINNLSKSLHFTPDANKSNVPKNQLCSAEPFNDAPLPAHSVQASIGNSIPL
jgi:hypothetical protein